MIPIASIITALSMPPSHPPVPVGRLSLRQRVGAGAVGEVHAAYDQALNRQVAIKLAQPSQAAQARLVRDAQHLAQLSHPNIKPDNVAVGPDGRVRVVDFGLARPAAEATAGGSRARAALDQAAAGAIAGTPHSISPEPIIGHSTDNRSGQFSFCMSLYRALYGRWPYHGRSWAELTTALITTDCRCPRARHVARSLRRALQRGLALAPSRRVPSLEALLAAISGDHARRRHHRALAWAAAVTSVALIGACICGQLYKPCATTVTPMPAPLIDSAASSDDAAPPPSAETCFVRHLAPFVTFPDNHSRRVCAASFPPAPALTRNVFEPACPR
ncbi:MAG: hypothetical protein Tsb0020_30450 [Haliangiales bacterium]